MTYNNTTPLLTTRHFEKQREMGFPPGYSEWGALETDVRHSEWRRTRNRNTFLIVAFCVALGCLSVWLSVGAV